MKNYIFCFKIVVLLIFIISCSRNNNEDHKFRVGVDPNSKVFLTENHNQAFLIYKKFKVKKRTLVHFDAHIDLNWIRRDELSLLTSNPNSDSLKSFLKSPYQYYIPRKKFLHVGNWIYPLLMDSSVTQLYWVVPDQDILQPQWLEFFKKGIKLYQKEITFSEINSFKINTKLKRIEGTLYRKPIIVCTIKNLPNFTSPILLDLDTDYFDFNSAIFLERLKDPLFWPDQFVKILQKKKLKADIVTICYSLEDGYNTLALRFIGEDLMRQLKAGKKITDHAKDILKLHRVLYQAAFVKVPLNTEHYRELVEKNFSADAASFYLLSQKYAAEGHRSQAINALKKAANIDIHYKFAVFHKANNLFYDKDYRKALSLYEKIVSKNLLTNNFIYNRLADCYSILGKLGQAEEYYRMLIQKEPENISLYSDLGNLLLKMKRVKEAENVLKHGLKLDSYHRDINFLLGHINLMEKKLDRAESYFISCSEYHQNYIPAILNLLVIAEKKQQFKLARKYALRLMKLDPQNPNLKKYSLPGTN